MAQAMETGGMASMSPAEERRVAQSAAITNDLKWVRLFRMAHMVLSCCVCFCSSATISPSWSCVVATDRQTLPSSAGRNDARPSMSTAWAMFPAAANRQHNSKQSSSSETYVDFIGCVLLSCGHGMFHGDVRPFASARLSWLSFHKQGVIIPEHGSAMPRGASTLWNWIRQHCHCQSRL